MNTSLNQSLARALNISTESVDVDINIGSDAVTDEDGAVVSPLAPATDEPIVEAQETELAEEAGEIEDTDESIEEADSDVETLESIYQHLSNTLDSGGLDTVSYEMFNLTMDHIYRKYDISAQDVLPSMESYGDDQLGNTEISMERVKDTLKTVKQGAGNFLKKLWFKIKQFIANAATLNLTMGKRVAAIKKKAQSMSNENVTTGEIELYSAKKLHIDGKVPSKNDIIKNYDQTGVGLSKLSSVSNEYFNSLSNIISEMLQKKHNDENKLPSGERSEKAIMELNKFLTFQNAKYEVVGDGSKIRRTKLKFKTTPFSSGEGNVNRKVEALTPSEVYTICNKIETNLTAIGKMSKEFSKGSLEKQVVQLSDQVGPLPGKDELSEAHAGSSDEAIKEMRTEIRLALTAHGKVLNYMNNVNKAMMDYCVQSMQSYSKSEKADNE